MAMLSRLRWTQVSLLIFGLLTSHLYNAIASNDSKYKLPRAPSDVIKIGVILPSTGSTPWILPYTLPAIHIAVDYLQHRTEIFGNRRVELNVADSECSYITGPLAAVDMYVNQSVNVFLGPACEYVVAPVARFSPHWGIPILTAGALVSAFGNKQEYGLLTRVQGTYSKYSEALMHVFNQFRWSNVALLYHNVNAPNSEKKSCFFCIEAMFRALRAKINRKPFNRDFDEHRISEQRREDIVVEASRHARM